MRKIIWSPEAEFDYDENIAFLLKEWTEKEAQEFIDKVAELLLILERGNTNFKALGYKNLYAVPVCYQITLIYRKASKNEIEIVRLWNTFQDPKKLNKLLNEYLSK